VAVEVLTLPGLGGSGQAHWQSRWEALHPEYERIHMPDWDAPVLEHWLAQLDRRVARATAPVVIVAHSLGCLAVAHWGSRQNKLHAALLVAPPDPESQCYPRVARGFDPVPLAPLPFVSCVVASRDDPYGSVAHAARCAAAWRSQLVDVGALGHINADSGLGDWPEGESLLRSLVRTADAVGR
jgi:uncharacterized protein